MLALHPHCERCDAPLPPEAPARICSFECTFCEVCGEQLEQRCPNCEGELVRRPVRPAEHLDKYPPVAVNGLAPAIPVLSVTSDAAAVAFYGDLLGFRSCHVYRPDPAREDPTYRVLRRDAAYVHLTSFPGDGTPPGHVYLRVPDVDALHRELAGRGVTFHLLPTDQSWGTREMVVADPDGNELHFHQE